MYVFITNLNKTPAGIVAIASNGGPNGNSSITWVLSESLWRTKIGDRFYVEVKPAP